MEETKPSVETSQHMTTEIQGYISSSRESDQGETEDEEVKMNCIGGECGMHDSDLSSDCEGDDSEGEQEKQQTSREFGVVSFVSEHLPPAKAGSTICRPKPIVSTLTPKLHKLSEELCSCDGESSSGPDHQSQDPSSPYEKAKSPQDSQNAGTVTKKEGSDAQQSKRNQCSSECKAKRVLSSNALATLSTDAEHSPLSPKRMKPSLFSKDSTDSPVFSLGMGALDQLRVAAHRDTSAMSSDDDELDRRLSEELDSCGSETSRENSPVPLLTPPQSPLTIKMGGGVATVCEWPSNLVVDSVMMTAATERRSMSPTTLQNLERDEFEDGMISLATETSSLTPLFRSIYVGND